MPEAAVYFLADLEPASLARVETSEAKVGRLSKTVKYYVEKPWKTHRVSRLNALTNGSQEH
jgi:hypothetical protein